MPRSSGSMAGEALVTVVMLVGPAVLASRLGWPLGEHTSWTWLWQYLRGGHIPDEAVVAALVVILWAVWTAHLVVVVLDAVALLRGLVPRVGLVRLVWVLAAGGATAASTHTAAVAAQTDTVADAPAQSGPVPAVQVSDARQEHADGQADRVVDRTRRLSHFGFDSAALVAEMEESLEPTIGMIDDFGLSGAPVVVTGHTDPVGDLSYNQVLSEKRAQAVADYLAQHLGEDVELEVRGAGSVQPPANPQASYGEYRRVEISYTLQPPAAADDPAPSAQAGAEEASARDPEPDQAQLDASTVSGQGPGADPVLVGAVAGTVGLGAGYAAGRRRTSGARKQPKATAPEPDTDEGLDSALTENPASSENAWWCEDEQGLARGAINSDGYVLVADTVRVDGRAGVAFTEPTQLRRSQQW